MQKVPGNLKVPGTFLFVQGVALVEAHPVRLYPTPSFSARAM